MIDIIGMLAAAAHWCVSCANDANTLPPGLGILGGAAGAAGGLGALTPMSDLYPPGTTTDGTGNLTWPNPDGTTSTKDGGGTVTNTSPTGDKTVHYPDGYTGTSGADGSHTFTDPYGRDATNPPSSDLPLEEDEVGNALPSALVTGPLLGGIEVFADGAATLGEVADGALEKVPEEAFNKADEGLAKSDAHDIDDLLGWKPDPPDTPKLPDPIMGQTGYVANDDGTVTRLNPDGSFTTPNADGSETTTQPGGTSTTTPPTATPVTGYPAGSGTSAGSSGDGS
jgi:hypothetical protein